MLQLLHLRLLYKLTRLSSTPVVLVELGLSLENHTAYLVFLKFIIKYLMAALAQERK